MEPGCYSTLNLVLLSTEWITIPQAGAFGNSLWSAAAFVYLREGNHARPEFFRKTQRTKHQHGEKQPRGVESTWMLIKYVQAAMRPAHYEMIDYDR